MSTMSDDVCFSCGLVTGLGPSPPNPSLLTLSRPKQLVLLENLATGHVTCHSIEAVEAILTTSTQALGWIVMLRTSDIFADVVINVSTSAMSDEIFDGLMDLRQRRSVRSGGTLGKLIVYRYPATANLADCLCHGGVSRVKWSAGLSAALPPFPHLHTDFLKLHANRSVMQKLSSFGDTQIDISCDQVSAAGRLIPNSRELRSGITLREAHVSLQEVSETFVVIVSDKALYLTKQGGTLVFRLPFVDVKSVTMFPEENLTCRERIVVVSSAVSGTCVLQSRFCPEVFSRLHSHTTAIRDSRAPSLDAAPKVSVSTSTAETQTDSMKDEPKWTVHQLAEQMRERDVTIALLRKRIDVLIDAKEAKSSKNAGKVSTRAEQENEILRHYVLLLENKLDELVNTTGNTQDPKDDLDSLLQRESQLRAALDRTRAELTDVSRSFEKSLADIWKRAVSAIRESVAHHLKSTSKVIQVTLPSRELEKGKALNRQLIEELRARETALEDLLNQGGVRQLPPSLARSFETIVALADEEQELRATIEGLKSEESKCKAELIKAVVEKDTGTIESGVTAEVARGLSSLQVQSNRVASLEVLLAQSTLKKIETGQLEAKLKTQENEIAGLRAQIAALKRAPRSVTPSKVQTTTLSRNPASANTERPKRKGLDDPRSRVQSRGIPDGSVLTTIDEIPDRSPSPAPFVNPQHGSIDFEQRLRDLEMLASFSSSRRPPAAETMGVVAPLSTRFAPS